MATATNLLSHKDESVRDHRRRPIRATTVWLTSERGERDGVIILGVCVCVWEGGGGGVNNTRQVDKSVLSAGNLVGWEVIVAPSSGEDCSHASSVRLSGSYVNCAVWRALLYFVQRYRHLGKLQDQWYRARMIKDNYPINNIFL